MHEELARLALSDGGHAVFVVNRPAPRGHDVPDDSGLLGRHDDGLPSGPGMGGGGILEEDLFGQAVGERDPSTWKPCRVELPRWGWVPGTAQRQVRDVHGWWAWVEVWHPTHRFVWVHQTHLRPGRGDVGPANG